MNSFNKKALSTFRIVLVVLFISCTNDSTNNKFDRNSQVEDKRSVDNPSKNENSTREVNEEISYDGVYSGSQFVSEGYELKAELIVAGDRWTAKSQMSFDNELAHDSPEYANGIVKGKKLYDESGMIEIGYVTGKSASINGYPVMTQ
jgi:hypothetical protein